MAMTKKPDWAEYKRTQRAKTRAVKQDHPSNKSEKHERFRALIKEAQALATAINADQVAYLQSLPASESVARNLEAMSRGTRYSFAEIYIPA